MIPLIIMAAASILQNKQKQEQARKSAYLQAMEHQAEQLGGHTDLARVFDQGRQINQMSADYTPLASLVGKDGFDIDGGDSNVAADDGTGSPGILSHKKPWEDDLDSALGTFDRSRGWR